MRASLALPVTEPSQVGEARRAVTTLAERLGLDEPTRARAALVVTEAANNLVKHAREGVVLLQALDAGGRPGVEALALDKGPGMADVDRCLRDGFSTAGSTGTGLGAIVRLSALADVYSRVPGGTALLARLWSGPPPFPPPGPLDVGAVSAPKTGEEVCGDVWAVAREGDRVLFLVADGLGHGPLAAEAARAAVAVFRASAGAGPAAILQAAHQALRRTRGAAVAVAEVCRGQVRFAGVGNIAGVVVDGAVSRSMMSHNGTVGHEARKFQELVYPFPKGALLVMHSDGLASRWGLDAYPGLVTRAPTLVAAVLYRDFQRGRDDVTVLVARAEGEA